MFCNNSKKVAYGFKIYVRVSKYFLIEDKERLRANDQFLFDKYSFVLCGNLHNINSIYS